MRREPGGSAPRRNASTNDEASARAARELLAEAQAMAGLEHPGIVTLYEVGTFCDELYLVMELVPGDTLGRWLDREPERPWTSIVEVFREAGRALAHAHDRRIAHGDFKPENILVDTRGRVRIADFGLSRALPSHAEARAAGQGGTRGRPRMVMGTPRYMAPEQYQGQGASPRADQFAFCVTLYEALYGQHPCAHDSPRSLVELPPSRAWRALPERADIPAWLARVVERGLSVDPADRFDSMYALLAELVPPVRRSRSGLRKALAGVSMTLACILAFVMGRDLAGPSQVRETWAPVVGQVPGGGARVGDAVSNHGAEGGDDPHVEVSASPLDQAGVQTRVEGCDQAGDHGAASWSRDIYRVQQKYGAAATTSGSGPRLERRAIEKPGSPVGLRSGRASNPGRRPVSARDWETSSCYAPWPSHEDSPVRARRHGTRVPGPDAALAWSRGPRLRGLGLRGR